MLTNNTRITVFCSKKQGRETFWFATVLDGVNYHGRDQIIVADKIPYTPHPVIKLIIACRERIKDFSIMLDGSLEHFFAILEQRKLGRC